MNHSNTRMTTGLFSSRCEDWETPQDLFDKLNDEFQFQIDVCATANNAKCPHFFSPADNGLNKDWRGLRCWMNPPYGKYIRQWMAKAYTESQLGALVVCLVHSRTDTRWWHDYAMKADEIRFIRGRLKFGNGKQSAPFPSCILVFRPPFDGLNIYNNPRCKSFV